MKALFFIGLVIPEPLAREIQELKTDFSSRYHTRHGLNTMPHITLKPPFRETSENIEVFGSDLSTLAEYLVPFDINLDGYGHFRKEVIFLNIKTNKAIEDIAQAVNNLYKTGKPIDLHQFKPHITIAHRDLNASEFKKAWQVLENKDFRASFKCESISMLVHRNGSWEIFKSFEFGGKS